MRGTVPSISAFQIEWFTSDIIQMLKRCVCYRFVAFRLIVFPADLFELSQLLNYYYECIGSDS